MRVLDAVGILDGHGIASKRHHFPAERHVLVVKHGGLERGLRGRGHGQCATRGGADKRASDVHHCGGGGGEERRSWWDGGGGGGGAAGCIGESGEDAGVKRR